MNRGIIVLFLISPLYLFSYQWPGSTDYLLSLFCSTKDNSVQDGIEFRSDGQAIYPLTDGDIIYYQDSFEFGDLDYAGDEGNILVLKHLGEFKSIYKNFSATDSFDSTEGISKTEMIGVLSLTHDNFIFSIYDDKKMSYINPQQILPFLEDNREPVINGVYIRNHGSYLKLSRNKKLPPGIATIYIDAWDVLVIQNSYKKFTPFSVNVFVDGFERYNASFSSLKEIDNSIYISGDSDILVKDFLSGGNYLYGGEVYLTTGSSVIEIVVKDIEGNEASKSYPVIVD